MASLSDTLAAVSALNAAMGIQSPSGKVLLRRFEVSLGVYFDDLATRVRAIELENLAGRFPANDETTLPAVREEVGRLVQGPITEMSEDLYLLLALWLARGYETASNVADRRVDELALAGSEEADATGSVVDEPRLPEATSYAARRSAKLVVGINTTTRGIIQDTIATGIKDGLGVPGTARLLRNRLSDMSITRSRLIALTEMNDAMSVSSFERIRSRGVAFKTTVLSDRPCPICIKNNGQGPVPVDQLFASGHDRTPFHPGCLCALVASRGPKGKLFS